VPSRRSVRLRYRGARGFLKVSLDTSANKRYRSGPPRLMRRTGFLHNRKTSWPSTTSTRLIIKASGLTAGFSLSSSATFLYRAFFLSTERFRTLLTEDGYERLELLTARGV
jgi:hypothetical protein